MNRLNIQGKDEGVPALSSLVELRLRRDIEQAGAALVEVLGRQASSRALERALTATASVFRRRRLGCGGNGEPDATSGWPRGPRRALHNALPGAPARRAFLDWYLWDSQPLEAESPGWSAFRVFRDVTSERTARVVWALRRSRVGIYEVLGVGADGHVDLRDLRMGDRVTVRERELAERARRWDLVLARIVTLDGASVARGVLAHLPPGARAHLESALSQNGAFANVELLSTRLPVLLARCDEILQELAEPPEITNLDREPWVETRLHFRLTNRGRALRALWASPFLDPVAEEPGSERNRFVWLREGRRRQNDSGVRPVLGTITVTGERLVVRCNSRERGLAFQSGMGRLLDGAARFVLSDYTDLDQSLLDDRQARDCEFEEWASASLPGVERCAWCLRDAFFQWLRMPVGEGEGAGHAPRDALDSPAGRSRLARTLNRLDEVQLAPGQPGTTVFFDLETILRFLDSCALART